MADRSDKHCRVGISGHQRLSVEVSVYVMNEIKTRLIALAPVTGVTSLAEGADQLFARCVLEGYGSIEVIVPSSGYRATFAQNAGLREYDRLLSLASQVITLPFSEPTEEAYLAAGKAIVDSCEVLFAVWDGMPARGSGGTADIVEYARRSGRETSIIWPSGVQRN